MIKKVVVEFDAGMFVEGKNISWEGVDIRVGTNKELSQPGTFSIDDIKILKRTIDFIEKEVMTCLTKESVSPGGSNNYKGF